MHRVFISYRHDDHVDLFDLLVMRLQENQFAVWTDKQISPGENWTSAIDSAIKDSVAVIVMMSKAAAASQYVIYEWSFALGSGIPVITMILEDGIDLHPRLSEFQYSDFRNNKRPWQEVLAGLKRIVENTQTTRQEQAFRWMQDADSELELDDVAGALDSYGIAYELADERLRRRIAYKMARLYIRQIERVPDKDTKADLLEKAQARLEEALRSKPDYHAARAYLGYTYRLRRDVVVGDDRRLEMLERARTSLKQALELQPDLIDVNGESWWNTYGGTLRRLGDRYAQDDRESANDYYKQAIEAYMQATQYGKKSSYPHGNLAILYMQMSDSQNMISSYRRVAAYRPTDASDFWGYGDQLVACIVTNNGEQLNGLFELYDAFAPSFARTTLIETLQSLLNIVDESRKGEIRVLIERLKNSAANA